MERGRGGRETEGKRGQEREREREREREGGPPNGLWCPWVSMARLVLPLVPWLESAVHKSHTARVGQYTVSKLAAYGQFAVCTWPAHGQYTACTQSAHGQHTFTLWPAHDQYVVSARLACARLGSAHLPVLGQHSNG